MILGKNRRFFMVIILLSTSAISFGMYQTETGRFIQQDPIGVRDGICLVYFSMTGVPIISGNISFTVQYHDGMNVYQYTQSNPVLSSDVYGLSMAFPKVEDSSQVCCKIKEKHPAANIYITSPSPYPGAFYTPVSYSFTTCTQETIQNPKGFNPEGACDCHYKGNKNITVYASHDGECCWCDVYFVTMSLFNFVPNLAYPINHSGIQVVCDDSKKDLGFFSEFDGQTVKTRRPYKLDLKLSDSWNERWSIKKHARVSCRAARGIKDTLTQYPPDLKYGHPWHKDGLCHNYTNTIWDILTKRCP